MFLNPTKTRFATYLLMLERLFKLRPAIEQTIVHPDWTTNTFHGVHCHKSLTKIKVIQTNYIRRDEFWDTCANFVHMVELVLMWFIKAFNGK